MVNYKLLNGVQFKDFETQAEIFSTLMFEAIAEISKKLPKINLEDEVISNLINCIRIRKWITISQIKELSDLPNLSNTRLGITLKKYNISKKRGKIKGDKNTYTLFLI